jgi:hypothetical protein
MAALDSNIALQSMVNVMHACRFKFTKSSDTSEFSQVLSSAELSQPKPARDVTGRGNAADKEYMLHRRVAVMLAACIAAKSVASMTVNVAISMHMSAAQVWGIGKLLDAQSK